jgi:hypothetical protein
MDLAARLRAHCDWGSFSFTAKLDRKRARSLAASGRRTPPFFAVNVP